MTDTTIDSAVPDGPVFSAEAYAAVEKAAASLRCLYAPSVLEHAAELLTDLWAAGERHGVTTSDWGWAADLPGGALSVVARRYERPETERTGQETMALARHLLEALTSDEIGLSAKLGPRASVVVERSSATPRGGFHGDANLIVGIYSNGGWDLAFNQNGASVLSIVAPASQAGASQVAEIVRALVHGEIGNPFRR
ncbi:hypothetical protein [Streptomyces acidiscabies]|uniref:Uncharacterized protein n=1 Tax=Streptomyces acidiscabies TaxID=42234 RepID=A0AAP6EKV8_9ACTN|nr:hypothetical protein [Streptomyces acidiscabies]MBZ3918133.1 hypothetical protein [Streptomyces acidiscabies]MDX2966469.1 hypothetical protein [Streptomyces acidiscabies]MDX3796415.1 hypothetical protein [Streptomyces acidiscabies]